MNEYEIESSFGGWHVIASTDYTRNAKADGKAWIELMLAKARPGEAFRLVEVGKTRKIIYVRGPIDA